MHMALFTAAEAGHVNTARTVFAYLVSARCCTSSTQVTYRGHVSLLQGHSILARLPFLECKCVNIGIPHNMWYGFTMWTRGTNGKMRTK
jgi:hypothetical protein